MGQAAPMQGFMLPPRWRISTLQLKFQHTAGPIFSPLGLQGVLWGAPQAPAQVAHFDAPAQIPAHRWADILTHRLSEDIVVRASAAVPPDWHARFSALWRRY